MTFPGQNCSPVPAVCSLFYFRRGMYRINKVIETKSEQIEIIPFGDTHLGNSNCQWKKFQELISYIANTPNCYAIGMGDYLDSILPKDTRFDPSEEFRVIEQNINQIIDTLKPIKDKIICLLTGNHEYHLHSAGYGDPVKRIAAELGIPYAGFSAFIKIKVLPKTHKPSLVIYAHHGWSAGRRTGNVINNVENLAQYWDADVYLVGHSHKLWSTRQVKIGWGGQRKIVFGNTGTFLETCSWGTTSYSERGGFPPLKLGVLKLKYYPKKADIHVSE